MQAIIKVSVFNFTKSYFFSFADNNNTQDEMVLQYVDWLKQ